MQVELITQADYAKRRGCSQVAVHKAVKAGRITLINGKIDPAVADVQWQRNTRVRAGSRSSDEAPLATPPAGGSPAGDIGGGNDYWEWRGRREKAEAELAELKLAEQRGLLMRRDVAQREVASLAAGFCDALMQSKARLVPLLIDQVDPRHIDQLLDGEYRQVLSRSANF